MVFGGARTQESFVDTSSYPTGMAYGLLVDAFSKNWRSGLRDTSDIAQLLATAARVQPTKDPTSAGPVSVNVPLASRRVLLTLEMMILLVLIQAIWWLLRSRR